MADQVIAVNIAGDQRADVVHFLQHLGEGAVLVHEIVRGDTVGHSSDPDAVRVIHIDGLAAVGLHRHQPVFIVVLIGRREDAIGFGGGVAVGVVTIAVGITWRGLTD